MPGSKPGERRGGRARGTPNKRSLQMAEAAKASGLLPHEFLLAVSRGEVVSGHMPTFAERLDAAAKAAPFYAPKLAAVDMRADTVTHVILAEPLSPEEREAETRAWIKRHNGVMVQ